MEDSKKEDFQKIIDTVKSKACLKQEIYRNTLSAFNQFKTVSKDIIEEMVIRLKGIDENVMISYQEKGNFEFHLKVGGDVILFQMHSNIFDFEHSNALYKTSYVKENNDRSYCGIINIYNFLADSIKYNRYDDSAYLIGRVFINMDNHFFVEGKKQLNFLHNDFLNQLVNDEAVKNIVQQAILYSMEFDLFTPPYRHVQEISVGQLIKDASGMRLKTGKRVGYKFSFEDE